MASPSFCDCIGEHGHLISKKGTGFYLDKYLFSPLLQQKVKTTASHSDFRRLDLGPFEARDLPAVQKIVGHMVGPMGMEHDGETLSFHGNGRVSGFSRLDSSLFDEIRATAWKEEFDQSTGIRKKGPDSAPPTLASNQESIWAVDEICDLSSFIKPEFTIGFFVTSP